MQASFLGIEIGGTKLQIVVGDAAANIVQRQRFAVVRVDGGEGIRRQIADALARLAAAGKFTAAGVGFGGPVDWQTGKICRSHHIKGWSDFDLGHWIEQQIHAPVFVDNDANVAALGEAMRGAGVNANPVFYITLGSGVGGGLVVDGKIYHGAKPGEVEIGHVRLDRQGTILESRCSGWSVDARIRELKTYEPQSALAKMIGPVSGGEAKHLAAALQAGDSVAQRLLAEIAEDLAFGLSHVVQLFHPEVIIMGGGLSKVGEPLLAAVAKSLRPFVMEVFQPGPRFYLAALDEDAVPIGALLLASTNAKRL